MAQDMTMLGWIYDEVDAYEEEFARVNSVALRLLAEGKAALVAARAAEAREWLTARVGLDVLSRHQRAATSRRPAATGAQVYGRGSKYKLGPMDGRWPRKRRVVKPVIRVVGVVDPKDDILW